MSIGAAGTKWTGSNGFGVPGYNPNSILTKELIDDPVQAIAFLKAIAHRESGRGNNLTEAQWLQAHRMFKLGSADAFLNETGPAVPLVVADATGATGAGLVRRALAHIGQKYVNILVPKDDANWQGPWDCAEFISWLVYQEGGFLYGCTDDEARPDRAEAYTGAWKNDLISKGIAVSVEQAANTVGGILLRYPPGPGKMGHIAVCDGKGGTVEAKGARYGVVADRVDGRSWDAGILLPGFTYETPDETALKPVAAPSQLYRRGAPNMATETVMRLQKALTASGYDPGVIDGDFGPETEKAVLAFQQAEGLTVDGIVGPETAAALGVSLTGERGGSSAVAVTGKPAERSVPAGSGEGSTDALIGNILPDIIALFLRRTSMSLPAKPGENADAIRLLFINALQAVLSGEKVDARQVILTLLSDLAGVPKSQQTPVAIPGSQVSNDSLAKQLILLIDKLAAADPRQPVDPGKLGTVNGALGETIGKLLNGRKSAIGIIGAVLTGLLGSAPVDSVVGKLAAALPIFGGTSGMFLSIFLGIAAWGVLGKAEKWKDAG
ncbi:peptidoglycan-binding domain-containing protein (plasmid) [Rhizobium leguminosarum]